MLTQLSSDKAHKYYKLPAMFGIKTFKAYLEWCEEAKMILDKDVE